MLPNQPAVKAFASEDGHLNWHVSCKWPKQQDGLPDEATSSSNCLVVPQLIQWLWRRQPWSWRWWSITIPGLDRYNTSQCGLAPRHPPTIHGYRYLFRSQLAGHY